MANESETLETLDILLKTLELPDFDSSLRGLESADLANVKRSEEFKHLMETVSLQQLRQHHIGELVSEFREGCAFYLYTLIRVHAGCEFSYHDMMAAICERRPVQLYEGSKIRKYWKEWWEANGANPRFSTLHWQPHSKNLNAAWQALTCESACLYTFLTHPHPLVRQSVARRTDLTEDAQFELVDDPDPMVRFELATNESTVPSVLGELANDLHSIVRRWVACHPGTPEDALRRLGQDPIEGVRTFLAQRS